MVKELFQITEISSKGIAILMKNKCKAGIGYSNKGTVLNEKKINIQIKVHR